MSDLLPTVLITGAGRGIGRGIALRLAESGHSLILNYRSDHGAAEDALRACEERRSDPRQLFLLAQADISKAADRDRLFEHALTAAGRIDALVNNAGIAPRIRADMLETSEESFDEVLRTNLMAPFFLSQRVALHWLGDGAPSLLPGGYAIVFVSSVSAEMVSTNRPQYCIAKAGLGMMSKLFAHRLAAQGISVFELRPGVIATDMTTPVREKYDALIADGGIPQRRWGTADDVARAVQALLAGQFPYSTGAVIHIDGGLSIQSL